MSAKRKKKQGSSEQSKVEQARTQIQVLEERADIPPALALVRILVGPTIVLTGMGLISFSYPLGVGIAYLGFLITLVEFIWEPLLLRADYRVQVALIGALTAFTTLFTLAYVKVPIPMTMTVFDYEMGFVDSRGMVGDIPWRDDYYEVRVSFTNGSEQDYTNVSIWIDTDLNIAHVGRLSKCSDAVVGPAIQFGPAVVIGPGGTNIQRNAEGPTHIPTPGMPGNSFNSFGSYSPVWSIHCDKVPARDSIWFVLAVVHLEKNTYNILPPQKPSYVHAYIECDDRMGIRHKNLNIRVPVMGQIDFLKRTFGTDR